MVYEERKVADVDIFHCPCNLRGMSRVSCLIILPQVAAKLWGLGFLCNIFDNMT